MNNNRFFSVIGIAAIVAIVVVMVVFFRNPYEAGPGVIPMPNGSTTPSSQQHVDSHLSLAKPAGGLATLIPISTGCKLNLGFEVVSGDLSAPGTVSYQLTIKNLGNVTCRSASLSVYYADAETFVSSQPKPTAAGYYWEFGALAPGKEVDIALTTSRGTAANGLTNEACLSADNGADSCANASNSNNGGGTAVIPPSSPSSPLLGGTPTPSPVVLSGPPTSGEVGIWVWTPISTMSLSAMQHVIDNAVANGFNTLYVTIDDYLDVVALPNLRTRQLKLQSYGQAMNQFLTLAAAKHLAVDAEAGWRDWAEPSNQAKALRIMTYVAAYNLSASLTNAPRFRGVQYDVEPYLLPTYATLPSSILTHYLQLVDLLAAQSKSNNLPLTMVIPHFYDAGIAWTPQITVNGIVDYPYNHLVRILSGVPGSRIIIMAYRNFAQGSDGSIDLSQAEINLANGRGVQVIVAQETGPVTPSYVTFHSLSKNELWGQVALINQAFQGATAFKGIAVDYLDPFLQLR